MTFFLLPLDDRHVIASSSPVIKASERLEFESPVALLAALNNQSAVAAAAVAASESAAYETGYARGMADAEAKMASVIAELVKRYDLQSIDRRNDIADAALGATRAILGTFDQVDILRRLILQALDRIDNGAPMTIEVAPAMAKALDGEFDRFGNVRIEAVDGMDPLDCIFQMPSGRVLAGLELQLSALAERWGVSSNTEIAEPVE
jgi:flagellar biosynthesis/type III secretory pathway protein FliH